MSVEQTQGPRIIVALDYAEPKQAMAMAEGLDPRHCRVKVGKELFTRGGPQWVRQLVGRGFDVFLDLKFHDIPHTVAQAVKAAADLGAWMVNVHASGGSAMLRAEHTELTGVTPRPLLIGVTVLTSMNESDLHEIGFSGSIEEQVARLAELTQHAELDGVVCSAREVCLLCVRFRPHNKHDTPNKRPHGTAQKKQQRSLT